MGSSPWFRVYSLRLAALFRLAFASAPGVLPLNLATKSNSLAHSPKGTRLGCSTEVAIALPLLVGTRFQILFHSGYPGSFHLSLTVLVRYRSLRVFSLGEWTPLLPTGLACPVVLKSSTGASHLSGTGLSPPPVGLSSAFPLDDWFFTPLSRCSCSAESFYPLLATPTRFHESGLGCSPFARHYSGNSFSSWRY